MGLITSVHRANSPGPEVFFPQLGHQGIHILPERPYLHIKIGLDLH